MSVVLITLDQCHNDKNMSYICVFRWRGRWIQHFVVLSLGNVKITNNICTKKKDVHENKTNDDVDNDKNFSLKFQRFSWQCACVCVDSHKHARTHTRHANATTLRS